MSWAKMNWEGKVRSLDFEQSRISISDAIGKRRGRHDLDIEIANRWGEDTSESVPLELIKELIWKHEASQ